MCLTFQQLQVQVGKLRGRVCGLEGDLVSAKEASAKILDHASSQMEGLREANKKVRFVLSLLVTTED